MATRDTTAEVNTSFSEDLAGPYLLVWDLSSSRMGAVELRFTEVITLEVNLSKTLTIRGDIVMFTLRCLGAEARGGVAS